MPVEIWGVVFDQLLLLCPPYEHKPDIVLGPRSPWMEYMRFQRGLTLVCKQWWELATRALHHRIVLRRMCQISALARALWQTAGTRYDFSGCVKDIALHDLGIVRPFTDAVLGDLRFILRRCTMLQSFSTVPHTNYVTEMWALIGSSLDGSWIYMDCMRSILRAGPLANLRHLDLELLLHQGPMKTKLLELHQLLSETPQLVSLKLGAERLQGLSGSTAAPTDSSHTSTLPMLCLPALRELELSVYYPTLVTWATSSCQFPNLTSLTFIDYLGELPLHLLDAHGARLTYLHCYPLQDSIDGSWYIGHSWHGFSALSNTSPMLQHLVTTAPFVLLELNRCTQPLFHLRYLDVWPHLRDATRREAIQELLYNADIANVEHANREKYPALGNNIRLLSFHGHSDIPRICHPAALSREDEIRTMCVRDVQVVQTSWCVRAHKDFTTTPASWPESEGISNNLDDPDDSDDPDFVLESADEEEDSESWVSEDSDTSEAEEMSDHSSLDGESVDETDTWGPDDVLTARPEGRHVCCALREDWDVDNIDSDACPWRTSDGPRGHSDGVGSSANRPDRQ